MPEHQTLGKSARSSLLWGGGFHFVRDVAQFGVMLVMVRLLTPEDYGSAALAQSIVGLVSVISFGTLVLHALQIRDPGAIDWQAQFSAGMVINTALFGVTVLMAWALGSIDRYQSAALPLAVLAFGFLVEIPGTLRHRMLETRHEWIRLRVLLIIGTLLGLGVGLLIALVGGGVWALVVQGPLFGLPAAIDLFWDGRWKPDWSWSWQRYRDTARFGVTRMASGAFVRGRQTVENAAMTSSYDFAGLGIFSRSVGLATLIAGRIGPLAMGALYPIVTRAEQGSAQFQKMSGLILRGVCWTTIPAAAFLALSAEDAVALLYGQRWVAVVPLLPLAVAGVALAGITATLTSLLLANNEVRRCLIIDVAAAIIAIGLALWFVPQGILVYLAALVVHGLLVHLVTLTALVGTGGIDRASLSTAFVPSMIASVGAALALMLLNWLRLVDDPRALHFALEAVVFSLTYLSILRCCFGSALLELLDMAPGGGAIARRLKLV